VSLIIWNQLQYYCRTQMSWEYRDNILPFIVIKVNKSRFRWNNWRLPLNFRKCCYNNIMLYIRGFPTANIIVIFFNFIMSSYVLSIMSFLKYYFIYFYLVYIRITRQKPMLLKQSAFLTVFLILIIGTIQKH